MTQTPETPNDRIDRREATLTRFAELSFQSYRHHDLALNRIEDSIVYLNTQMATLSQTQAECLQLIATNTVEINRIWQHLERQSGNGRSE